MYCPICAQEPINCICTEVERQQFSDIEDLEEEIARLRLTDAEREAVQEAVEIIEDKYFGTSCEKELKAAATLRGLLERMGGVI